MAPPSVSSVSPTSGPTTGGTAVTIIGTSFTGATAVTFSGTAATSFTVNSSTQISAITPARTVGGAQVIVTTSGGTSTNPVFFTYHAASPPSVSSVNPTSGPTTGATVVTITGSNFTGATTVTFSGTAATSFTVNSSTQITATTPPRPPGTALVVVTTPAGTSNSVPFFFIAAPVLNGLSPTHGPAAGGNSVAITGINLTSASAVRFGNVPALFTVGSATQISATAPPGTGPVLVTVISPGGTSNGIFYDYVAGPVINGVSPAQGPTAGGNQVTINGSDLALASVVHFGANPASFAAVSAGQIVSTAPPGTGAVQVTITTPGGTSAGITYTYVPPPQI